MLMNVEHRTSNIERRMMEIKINLLMIIYAILVVGAASSRDDALLASTQLFFAAGIRSHEISRYFDLGLE